MASNGYAIAEFECGGKTYRIRTENSVTFSPYFFVNQVRDSIGQYKDLITDQLIVVNWQQVGVIRVLETHD